MADETNGILTSPNFGVDDYPNNLNDKQTIQVEKGKAVKIHFTDFDLEGSPGGACDYVTITEGDGSTLVDIRPNSPSFGLKDVAEDFVSRTDTVHVLFRTDNSVTKRGWRLIWGEYKGADFFDKLIFSSLQKLLGVRARRRCQSLGF